MIWKALKEIATRHKRPGSTGYYVEIIRASEMFVTIMAHLPERQREKQEAEFNEDREVTAGVVMRKDLIEAGLLRE